MFYKSYSVNIELNNLYAMYLVYEGKCNIYGEVEEFRKTRMPITKFLYNYELAKRNDWIK